MFLSYLAKLFRPAQASPADVWSARAISMHKMVPVCPACGQSLERHMYTQLAEAGNEQDIHKLLAAVRQTDWLSVSAIHSFDGTKNAVLATAISCPSGAGSVLTQVDPFELYENAYGLSVEPLLHEQWQVLLATLADPIWRPC